MKTWMKAVVCIVLSFSFLFISLGYAALTDHLTVTGTTRVDIPSGIYIIDMERSSSSRLDVERSDYYPYTTTLDASLSKSSRNQSGTVTYKITVFNNTQYEYAYRDIYYQEGLYNNNKIGNGITISCSLANATAANKIIAPGATKEFTVTYTLSSSNSSANYNQTYTTVANVRFGINVNSLEQAHDVLMEKFKEILNSASSYAELTNKINDKFDGNQEWTSNFIGNVDGSNTADSVTMNNLFGGRLQMVIGDQQQTVTALIKHEPVDGNDATGDSYTITYNNGSQQTRIGCEYTIYLTTAKLGSSSFNSYPTVYAAVFTCNQTDQGTPDEWYMKGLLFKGTARVVGYMGEESGGSFDTGTWRSAAETYVLSDNYSFTVPQGLTIQEVSQMADDGASKALAELLTEAKAYIDSHDYAGTGLEELERVYQEASPYFTVSEDGTITINAGVPLSTLMDHIDAVSDALKAFENAPQIPTT